VPFPGHFQGAQNANWFSLILGQIEQQSAYNAFNFSIGLEGIPDASGMPLGFSVNSTVFLTSVSSFQCPSDANEYLVFTWPTNGKTVTATKGNYMVCWGNTVWSQLNTPGAGLTATQNLPVVYRKSAFGHQVVRLAEIIDGTSSTMFTSEINQGKLNDARGAVWTAASIFTTRFTPNGVKDSYRVADPPTGGADRMGVGFCVNDPVHNLPCVDFAPYPYTDYFYGARSRHPGGVNAGIGDGSVRFIKDTVSEQIWVALGSVSGGEVISSDAY
jgi:hypothetical protein